MFSSQEIGSSLVSFFMIFEALKSELYRSKFHSLSSKILRIPELNLCITLFKIAVFLFWTTSNNGWSGIQYIVSHHLIASRLVRPNSRQISAAH